MEAGSSAQLTHDIVINKQLVFKAGETVTVEVVSPNEQRPEFKYVVTSALTGTRLALSDADLRKCIPIVPSDTVPDGSKVVAPAGGYKDSTVRSEDALQSERNTVINTSSERGLDPDGTSTGNQKRFCERCGWQIVISDAQFCPQCGTSLANSSFSGSDGADSHFNLGLDFGVKGLTDDAIREFKETIRIRPEYAEAHYNLGYALVAKDLFDDAIPELKEAIRIRPDFPEAHNQLGVLLHHKGLVDDAIHEYQEAIRIRPENAEVHSNLGLALSVKDLYDDSIREFNEAIRMDPDVATTHYYLGLAFGAKSLFDDAIRELKEAIRIDPDFADAKYHLELALQGTGKH